MNTSSTGSDYITGVCLIKKVRVLIHLQAESHCFLKGQVFEDNSDVFNELMGHADITESWVDTARSEAILRISFNVCFTSLF